MQIEHRFFAGIMDVDEHHRLTNKAMLEACSNMANYHGYLLGLGSGQENPLNLGWVVLNWKLEVYDRPAVNEDYLVRTWSSDHDRVRAFREFEIERLDGTILARAQAVWLAVNLSTGMPLRLTEEIIAPYESESGHRNFPDYVPSKGKVPEDAELISEGTFRIPYSMLDCYHHTHNTCYFDLLSEALPESLQGKNWSSVEVVYKKEILLHEEVRIRVLLDAETTYAVFEGADDEVLHAVLILENQEA